MRTAYIGVTATNDVNARAKAASKGTAQGMRISFASLELMHRILTPNRWGVLQAMMGRGDIGVRELARALHRNVTAVRTDIAVLANAGLIVRADNGAVAFPYDAVRVDFVVKAA